MEPGISGQETERQGRRRSTSVDSASTASPPNPRQARVSRHRVSPGTPLYAAIDLGTNNCRMLIGAPQARGFRVVDSYNRLTRLGEGLHQDGRLGERAMDRTLQALEICAGRLGRVAPRAIRAVATEACRRATNGGDFLARVRDVTGLLIDVITAREEAELAVESCAPLLLPRAGETDGRAILFDIGGGSTEIAWVRVPRAAAGTRDAPRGWGGCVRPEMIGSISIPFGVVTLAEAVDGAFNAASYGRVVDRVVGALGEFERTHCIRREINRGPVRMMGTSGTLTTLATVSLGLQRYQRNRVDGLVLDTARTRAATRHLRGLGEVGLQAHACIGPGRARFVLPGCAIFEALQLLWPAAQVTVADRGLRDGILLRMMREHSVHPATAARSHRVVHYRG